MSYPCPASEKPVIKAGIIGDIQGLPSRNNLYMRNLGLALDLLRERQIDTILNLGDLAESAVPETYRLYWEMIEERFGKNTPDHVACEGNHDCNRPRGVSFADAFANACRGLRRPPGEMLCVNLRGYDFFAFSSADGQNYSDAGLERLDAALKESELRTAGKPIFLLTHYPPAETVAGSSGNWRNLRLVLNRHPRVISLSGHTHYPLEDERGIWQGEFTAVTCSTLAYGCLGGTPAFNVVNGILPFARECVQMLIMEVYGDRIEFRRYHVLDKREIAPERRWIVNLPFRREDSVDAARRSETRRAPEFADDARLMTRYDYGYIFVIFPRPVKGDFALLYRVEIAEKREDGSFADPVTIPYAGDFYRREKNQTDFIQLKLPGKGMKHSTWYRIRVYPVESFGKCGKPLELMEYTWPGYSFRDGTPLYPQE